MRRPRPKPIDTGTGLKAPDTDGSLKTEEDTSETRVQRPAHVVGRAASSRDPLDRNSSAAPELRSALLGAALAAGTGNHSHVWDRCVLCALWGWPR